MSAHILIADDERDIRETTTELLKAEGFTVFSAENGKAALEILKKESVDLLITDLNMPQMSGIDLIEQSRLWSPGTISVIITAFASVETAIKAIRLGASDYILKPLDFDELMNTVTDLLSRKAIIEENRYLREQEKRKHNFNFIVGDSAAMKKLYSMIDKVGPSRSSVLITGRSGTGKELVARAIHDQSDRKDQAFVAINCGAIPESLFESELFGHKKGSFTGANSDRSGMFVMANGGTLFLDEIGEMPLSMQVKLLRVLQEGEIRPVGSSSNKKVDVRIIAATNKDLRKEVAEQRFREDLFYRLNIIELQIPPLHERQDDIPLLCNHFVDKYSKELNRPVKGLTREALFALTRYDWPGQVRELENVIERAFLLCNGDYITLEDLPSQILSGMNENGDQESMESLNDAMLTFERNYIQHMLAITNRQKGETARLLGVDPSTLYRKMEKLGLRSEQSDQD